MCKREYKSSYSMASLPSVQRTLMLTGIWVCISPEHRLPPKHLLQTSYSEDNAKLSATQYLVKSMIGRTMYSAELPE